MVVEAVDSQVESCRRSLQALEPVWPGSKKLKELLNDVQARAKEVVVAANASPTQSTKKRKSSQETALHSKRAMGSSTEGLRRPQSSTRINSGDWHYESITTPADQLKRPRSEPRYQTSHTRTNSHEEDLLAQPWPLPMTALNATDQQTQAVDMTFDVGGVEFNGLDMLQGFTGTDLTSFWSTFNLGPSFNPQSEPIPQAPISTHTTLNSAAGTGPSPNAWVYPTGTTGPDGSGMNSDFWSQIAGGTFDWGADPSVPFNI